MQKALYILFIIYSLQTLSVKANDTTKISCNCAEKLLIEKKNRTIAAISDNNFSSYFANADTLFYCLRLLDRPLYYKYLNDLFINATGTYTEGLLVKIESLLQHNGPSLMLFLANDSGNLELIENIKEIVYQKKNYFPEIYANEKKNYLIDINKLSLSEKKKAKLRMLFE
ncbi:MAG: hypothetical protein SGJ10_09430 [Bacteroidota bacterium]|nr:hypothetical protein [Bacteroidota bacterium]